MTARTMKSSWRKAATGGTRSRASAWRSAILAAAVAAGAAFPLTADDYSYFQYDEGTALYGYESYDAWLAATNTGSAASSSASSLDAAYRTGASDALGLEARYRTWDESDGTALRSDALKGMFITIR